VDIVESRETGITTFSVRIEGLSEVNLDKIPMGANSTIGSVGDKEKAVERVGDGGVQRSRIEGRQVGDEWVDFGSRKGGHVERQKRRLGRAGAGGIGIGSGSGLARAVA